MVFESLIEAWEEIVQDPDFSIVRDWKNRTGGKAVGYFPVYTPIEILHAGAILPVGVMGAGNRLEIAHADSRFGSFICSVAKSTMELGLRSNLNVMDGMIFHSICDTARNLAFLFQRNFSGRMKVDYIHFPQNPESSAAVDYLEAELRRLKTSMEELIARPITDEDLNRSIAACNENRNLVSQCYALRSEKPHMITTRELYILLKAGNYLRFEDHSIMLRSAMKAIENRTARPKDKIRVVLEGSFCEQPPLDLLQAFEDAGCYIVNDDLLPVRNWYLRDIEVNGNPLRALAENYVKHSRYSSVRHDWSHPRMEGLVEKARASKADAVVFCIAKFCEPAYFDYVPMKDALERENIPHLLVEFEEKMWTFEKARNEIETFVESILFD